MNTANTIASAIKSIARAYSLRGEVIKRAKTEGALAENASKVMHSKKAGTVKLTETYNVPADFALSDEERKALATIRAYESLATLTGLTMEVLKTGMEVEARTAKSEVAEKGGKQPKAETPKVAKPEAVAELPKAA